MMDHVWDTLARYEREDEYAAAERGELSARDRAELNCLIDEQRLRDQAADDAYWEYQAELEDERRQDQ